MARESVSIVPPTLRRVTSLAGSRATDIVVCGTSTFISADCFKPPPRSTVMPRVWDRISVPTAIERWSDHKIYKRVSVKPRVDLKYRAVVAELESQGLAERKCARKEEYMVPYGSAEFESETKPEVTGEQELAEARGMSSVKLTTYMHGAGRGDVHYADQSIRPSQERLGQHMEG